MDAAGQPPDRVGPARLGGAGDGDSARRAQRHRSERTSLDTDDRASIDSEVDLARRYIERQGTDRCRPRALTHVPGPGERLDFPGLSEVCDVRAQDRQLQEVRVTHLHRATGRARRAQDIAWKIEIEVGVLVGQSQDHFSLERRGDRVRNGLRSIGRHREVNADFAPIRQDLLEAAPDRRVASSELVRLGERCDPVDEHQVSGFFLVPRQLAVGGQVVGVDRLVGD